MGCDVSPYLMDELVPCEAAVAVDVRVPEPPMLLLARPGTAQYTQ